MLSATFEITVQGEVDPVCADALAPATVTLDSGFTLLRAEAIDQAALHGLLDRVAELGLTLMSVSIVDAPVDRDAPPPSG